MESGFIKIGETSEIAPGKIRGAKIEGKYVLIANVNGSFFAIGGKCTHAGGDLAKGTLEGNIVTCPKHKTQFDVTTGKVVAHPQMPLFHPKAKDEPTYQVKIEKGSILVKL
jgi:nitrite reductase/ring-hydroxylating ferredoxin subunit